MTTKKKMGSWTRVFGPDLDPANAARCKKNTDILNSQAFKDACSAAGIPPTRRQASRFKNKKGKAYSHRNR